MLKGFYISEDDMDEVINLLNGIEVVIDSSITYKDDLEIVSVSMESANKYIKQLKKVLSDD